VTNKRTYFTHFYTPRSFIYLGAVSIDIELNRKEKIMKTSTKILATLVLSSSLLMTGVMASENGHKGDGFKIERLVKKLSLTDEQSTQIKALVAEKKAKRTEVSVLSKDALKAKKEAKKAEILAMFENPSFDEATVRAKIAERHKKRLEHAVSKMSTQHAIYQLLDEKQRAKFLKMLQKKHKKMNKKKGKKKNNNG